MRVKVRVKVSGREREREPDVNQVLISYISGATIELYQRNVKKSWSSHHTFIEINR